MKRCILLFTMVIAMAAAQSQAATIVWQDDDPLSGTSVSNNGLIVNTVDASVITSDPTRTAVGDVIFPSGGPKFVSIGSTDLPAPAGSDDQPLTFTVDYFVPDTTTLDALPDGSSPDLFWLQISYDGGNNGSAGFIGAGAAGNGWNTITLNSSVPAGTSTIQGLMVMADGGFGAGTPNGTGVGTAVFVDNFRIEVETIPEPTSLLLLAGGALGLVARRR